MFSRILTALLALTSYVNPFIGTSNFGATNPGAVCPGGMVSVSPFNVMGSEDNVFDKDSRWWSTPYTSDNCFFTGFSHVNLSGVGCPEVGSLLVMPTVGELDVDYHNYGSAYSGEVAHPGYYSVNLAKYGITAEASATARTAVERFTFAEGGVANVLLNLGEGLSNETGAWVRKVSPTEIEGCRLQGTFCYNPGAVFPVYFVMRVDREPAGCGFWKKQREMKGVEAEWTPDSGKYKIYRNYGREMGGDELGYWFTFGEVAPGEQIVVRLGVSFVSVENARENLLCEQEGLSFDEIASAASACWEEHLGRIRVEGGSERDMQVFYTALYHTLIHPSVLSDCNGQYPLMESDGIGQVEPGHVRYSVFSLWDTYRNLHQLMTLVYPEKQIDMVRSMVDCYKEWGWMPKWELFGRETFTMEGDPAIPVITDTWLKGLRDFDIEAAYEAALKSATTPGSSNLMRPDIDPYIEKGYIPLGFYAGDNSGDNSVSHALEYYIADYALSLLAADLGHTSDSRLFLERSLGYKAYYSRQSGTLRPLQTDGSFLAPFDPADGADFSNAPGFHEGSAWNYTFYVPHDIRGLASLMGGSRKFVSKLQMVFDKGLYDPANEPDIAYPYLFSYFKGEEWRTQKEVRKILQEVYSTEPAGIPGNDDCGTMSAWAVFSMMGFYPDCPGPPYYTLTTPSFSRIEISLDPSLCAGQDRLVITASGPTVSGSAVVSGGAVSVGSVSGISAPTAPTALSAPTAPSVSGGSVSGGSISGNSAPTGYISSMRIGGRRLKSYRISHSDLVGAGTLDFRLSPRK